MTLVIASPTDAQLGYCLTRARPCAAAGSGKRAKMPTSPEVVTRRYVVRWEVRSESSLKAAPLEHDTLMDALADAETRLRSTRESWIQVSIRRMESPLDAD